MVGRSAVSGEVGVAGISDRGELFHLRSDALTPPWPVRRIESSQGSTPNMGQHRVSSRNSCETRNAVKSSVDAVSVDRRIFTLHPEKGGGPRSSESTRS